MRHDNVEGVWMDDIKTDDVCMIYAWVGFRGCWSQRAWFTVLGMWSVEDPRTHFSTNELSLLAFVRTCVLQPFGPRLSKAIELLHKTRLDLRL